MRPLWMIENRRGQNEHCSLNSQQYMYCVNVSTYSLFMMIMSGNTGLRIHVLIMLPCTRDDRFSVIIASGNKKRMFTYLSSYLVYLGVSEEGTPKAFETR